MSFRKEIKFSLNKTKMHQFLEWIENKGAQKLYDERNMTRYILIIKDFLCIMIPLKE